MPEQVTSSSTLEFHPLTIERWGDFEQLFGPRGANAGCWCMWWRLARSEFERQRGEENKTALKRIVESGEIPGILGYMDGQAIAWCSAAPRESFPALERSRIRKRIDEIPVWSVVCFFIAKPFRHQRIMAPLLRAAIAYARDRGARVVEGYPIEPGQNRLQTYEGYVGIASTFRTVGFKEVQRRSDRHPIMRYIVKQE